MTEQRTDFDIIIVGNGLVGRVMALALKQSLKQRVSIGLAGETHKTKFDQRAFTLSPPSLSMLECLGVIRHIKVPPTPVHAIEVLDHGLDDEARKPLLRFDMSLERNDQLAVVIESSALGEAIDRRLEAFDVTPLTIRSPDAFDVEHNRIIFAEGFTGRLVIAADGARSKMRQKAGIETFAWDYNQRGLVARVEHEKPHQNIALQSFLPTGPFVRLPLEGENSSIVWSTSDAEARTLTEAPIKVQQDEIRRRFGFELGVVTLRQPLQSWPLNLVLARRFIAPRFALIGDAAHKVHPLAGLGFNLGLRDIAALTEVIVDQVRLGLDPGTQQGLEAYQQWRRFDNLSAALTLDKLNGLHSNSHPLTSFLRRTGLAVVDRMPALKTGLSRAAAGTVGDIPKLMRGELI